MPVSNISSNDARILNLNCVLKVCATWLVSHSIIWHQVLRKRFFGFQGSIFFQKSFEMQTTQCHMNENEKVEGTIPECLQVLSYCSCQTLLLLVADKRKLLLVILFLASVACITEAAILELLQEKLDISVNENETTTK